MGVQANFFTITGVCHQSHDEFSQRFDELYQKNLIPTNITSILLNPFNNGNNDLRVITGIVDKKLPQSGVSTHSTKVLGPSIKEVVTNRESVDKLSQFFKQNCLENYIDLIKTYKVVSLF